MESKDLIITIERLAEVNLLMMYEIKELKGTIKHIGSSYRDLQKELEKLKNTEDDGSIK